MLDLIVAKGGYWIIIALMMTGLYIVFAATNLIKRLVGLSIFQTSVFVFYITLGKVAGGTAPILHGRDYPYKPKPADPSGGHGGGAPGHGAGDGPAAPDLPARDLPARDLPAPAPETVPDAAPGALPAGDARGMHEAVPIAGADTHSAYPGVQEIYSNPLPHVLILTAIVVGVATLAVGLAIVVRIREAYGTIEADEVRALDIVVAAAEEEAADRPDTGAAGAAA